MNGGGANSLVRFISFNVLKAKVISASDARCFLSFSQVNKTSGRLTCLFLLWLRILPWLHTNMVSTIPNGGIVFPTLSVFSQTSANFYQSQDGNVYSSPEWMLPGIVHTRGGLSRPYSQLVHIADSEYDDGYHGGCGDPPFVLTTPLSPSKITILTRGFCGSTCALFTNHLANYEHVKTVVAGGSTPGIPMQYSSFPGLEVLDSPGFYNILDVLLQVRSIASSLVSSDFAEYEWSVLWVMLRSSSPPHNCRLPHVYSRNLQGC